MELKQRRHHLSTQEAKTRRTSYSMMASREGTGLFVANNGRREFLQQVEQEDKANKISGKEAH